MTSVRHTQARDAHPPAGPRKPAQIGRTLVFLALGATIAAIPAQGIGAGPEPADEPSSSATAGSGGTHASLAPLALIENRRLLSYPFEQVWPTAIRYLRIDRGFEVTDRDEDAGYILFRFGLDESHSGSGSLEMFATEDAAGRPSVSVSVSTGAGPVHLPNTLLDGIAAKVRSERGQPAPPPKQDEPTPPKQDDPNDDTSVPLMPPAEDP